MKIILASQSPRRKELLEKLDIPFEIQVKSIDEVFPAGMPSEEVPVYLSKLKAEVFLSNLKEDELVITSDTIVVIDKEILGKPRNRDEAFAMLQKLSGKSHQVITGVSLTTTTEQISFMEITEVNFASLAKEEIDFYLDSEKPYDKAGSYGIQDWIGYAKITGIKGCYYNVMGLPVYRIYEQLKKMRLI